MMAYAKEQATSLAQELGGDRLAVRAARAIVQNLKITTLAELVAYRDKVGDVDFRYEVGDLRNFGPACMDLLEEKMPSPQAT